jgi:nitroimidazol reductase NimA-like FMN-containing flavoprotein (pyridoxamine 5'-phosphate oxidase superfamily)
LEVNAEFDVDAFLARPLVARIATAGPSIRPVWFLWEDAAFWWLTGSWSRLPAILDDEARVAVVVDTCDLATGEVRQVTAVGDATIAPFDRDRAYRKLCRYLGPDPSLWDQDRFALPDETVGGTPGARFVRLAPDRLRARDLSYAPPPRP